jgi:hypothetical protein
LSPLDLQAAHEEQERQRRCRAAITIQAYERRRVAVSTRARALRAVALIQRHIRFLLLRLRSNRSALAIQVTSMYLCSIDIAV